MIEHCYTRKSINKLVLDCCKIVVIRKSNKLPSWSNHGSSKIDRLERRWKLVQPRWKEEMEACGGHGWLHPLRQTQPLHSPSALAGMLPLRRALITASTVLLIHTRKKSEHETEKINSISRANLERRHFLYKKRSDQRKSQDCLHYIVNGFAFSMEWYRPRGKLWSLCCWRRQMRSLLRKVCRNFCCCLPSHPGQLELLDGQCSYRISRHYAIKLHLLFRCLRSRAAVKSKNCSDCQPPLIAAGNRHSEHRRSFELSVGFILNCMISSPILSGVIRKRVSAFLTLLIKALKKGVISVLALS